METQAYKAFVLFQVAYCTSIILIKLSIALTFVRIMTDQVIILWILRITVGLFTLVTTAVAIYCMFQCRPIAKSWDPTIEGIVSDLIISALPIPLLWNVKINRYSKIAAGFLLSLGLFACICAIVRLSYTLALNATEEYLFQVYGVTVWCFAEVGVALTVGCLSTLRPLCASCLGGSMKSTGRSTSFRSGDRYELRSKNGVIHSSVQHGQVQSGATAVSDGGASFTDNESNRSILGPADIRVIKQYHVDSRSAV
ncbi:hypothetical protein SLS55_002032 [Diplodia seriata]|uniref:Rhodopsin domain-containing protein n=1 Tax=Diplodia seriata TaxID=420778 RepID=A0ABR3CR17_9PEZI